MSKVEKLYQQHLNKVRERARKLNLPFVDVLWVVFKPDGENALADLLPRNEQELIARYRVEFFEMIANDAIEFNEEAVNAIANNKAKEISLMAVTLQKKQDAALAEGRKKGTEKNKAKGDVLKNNIQRMNNDLLERPASEGWGIEARANYIANKVERKESYVRKLIATPRKSNQA